eukprot:scaffold18381_cov122-Skeletonema_dohrnii-CCMP3373.AAC.3
MVIVAAQQNLRHPERCPAFRHSPRCSRYIDTKNVSLHERKSFRLLGWMVAFFVASMLANLVNYQKPDMHFAKGLHKTRQSCAKGLSTFLDSHRAAVKVKAAWKCKASEQITKAPIEVGY